MKTRIIGWLCILTTVILACAETAFYVTHRDAIWTYLLRGAWELFSGMLFGVGLTWLECALWVTGLDRLAHQPKL